jgi:catechol 2,3-dioxygenase-like lactoylglutathione lyase family enzyme
MATTAATRITDVGTVGVPVTDQDRAIRFYCDTLGFEKWIDAEYGEGQRWVEVAPPGGTTSIALVLAPDEESVGVETQIRLTTQDAAADHATLKAAGVRLDELLPYPVPMFVFRDDDGNSLIAVERPEVG